MKGKPLRADAAASSAAEKSALASIPRSWFDAACEGHLRSDARRQQPHHDEGQRNMKTRTLGSLAVSVVGLGCNNFGARLDAGQTAAVVRAALDAGIDFFDTADIYGGTKSEEYLGRALHGVRDSVVIATKFGIPIDAQRQGGASPQYIARAVEDSLRRLGTDRIDLYQLHRPDPQVPIEDTLGALGELVAAGKVREIGSSNFSSKQIAAAETAVVPGAARFVSVQNEYSLLQRGPERSVLDACAQRGIGFLPYFPLASGALSGKYRQGQAPPVGTRLAAADSPLAARFLSESALATIEALAQFAEARGRSLLELAHSFLLAQKSVVSVIGGATSAEQVRANVAAADWQLSADDLGEIDRIAPRSYPAGS
jgi:aryl-alcohol dehydrogenase-like predicted oxidoreductase